MVNDRPHRPNRHDLHPERAPERDGTAPSEMSGCLPEAMREDRQTLSDRAHGKAPCALTLLRLRGVNDSF